MAAAAAEALAAEERYPLAPLVSGERERLLELRAAVADAIMTVNPADAYWASTHALRRMLLARKQNIANAAKMYRAIIAFRTERQCWRLQDRSFYVQPECIARYFPWGVVGRDREGHPLLIERPGKIDLVGISAVTPVEDFLTWVSWYHECQESIMSAASSALGKDVHRMTIVIDMEGIALRHMAWESLAVLKRRTRLEEDNYPEVVRRVLLINTPSSFPTVWGIIKLFMDQGTVERFQILGSDYLPTLLKYIDESNLPAFLGGKLHDALGDGECRCGGGAAVQRAAAGSAHPPPFFPSRRGMVAEGGVVPPCILQGFGVPAGQGLGEEVTLPKGARSTLTVRVPAGATVSWRWAPFDAGVGFSVAAAPAASAVAAGVIDVTEPVYGVHILAAGYPFIVEGGSRGVGADAAAAAAAIRAANAASAASSDSEESGSPRSSAQSNTGKVDTECNDGSLYRTTASDVGAVSALPSALPGSEGPATAVVAAGSASTGAGSWTAPANGGAWVVRLAWDNVASWVNAKLVCRRVDVALAGRSSEKGLYAADPGAAFAAAREQHRGEIAAVASAWTH